MLLRAKPMAQSRILNYRNAGFTLIEVLVALAIIGISMTAIIKVVSQQIRATQYLQNKTVAMWVGKLVLNEIRAGLVKVPGAPARLQESTEMLGRTWYWQATKEDTLNQNIKKIAVRVDSHAIEDEQASSLVELETYV
jgi:general secretion pathway protein I